MITIYVKDFNSDITQKSYDDIINALDLNRLQCPKCNHFGVIVHGYYDRAVKTKAGTIRLVVMRVKCKQCNKTHAILLSLIVPYQTVSLNDQIRIINNDKVNELMDDNPDISESDVSRVRMNFKRHYLQRLKSFNLLINESIVLNCFKVFKKQFLQIKCTSNILFTDNHIT